MPLGGAATGVAPLIIGGVAGSAPASAGVDRTLAYTPYVRVAGSQHREIALTFDDGPGPYTYYHAPMASLTAAEQRAELLDGARAVERNGASLPRLFRPPYGAWNSHTLDLLRSLRSSETVALPRIITKLRARGYRLVTVPRLLLDNPPPPDQNVYSGIAGGD